MPIHAVPGSIRDLSGTIYFLFLPLMNCRILIPLFFSWLSGFSQKDSIPALHTLDASPFYGSIILHNPDISHLIQSHPRGIILSWNKKSFGAEAWEQEYNYPDFGFSFVYQDMENRTLGSNYALFAHYNFYFLKRMLQFRMGQGIAYNTSPYDKTLNFRNNAYGSHFLSTTYAMVNYYREEILPQLGFKAGIALIHYSNANFKAPNTSTNSFTLNAGLVYSLENREKPSFRYVEDTLDYRESIHANLVFRGGMNESDVINSGQFPFFILSAYADKRLGRKSAIQFGGDLFFSRFLKELIRYQSIAFPDLAVDAGDDYKRAGLFIGHELFINKMSVITQLGYYVYYPFDFEGRMYNRIGLKRYFGDRFFGAITLKSHAAKAEAVEFGFGIRL